MEYIKGLSPESKWAAKVALKAVANRLGGSRTGKRKRASTRKVSYDTGRSVRAKTVSTVKRAMRTRTSNPKFISGYRLNTKGYSHRKFRRARKWNPSKYFQKGYVRHVERGGVVSEARCAYIGHATGTDQLSLCISNFLIRELFRRMGFNIQSMETQIADYSVTFPASSPGKIGYTYQIIENGQVYIHEIPIPGSVSFTFSDLASALDGSFFNISATHPGVLIEKLIFRELWFHASNSPSVTSQVRIDLTRLVLDIEINSHLTLQNRTLAGLATGTDQSSMLDVANNPVEGKKYTGKGTGTTLRFNNNAAPAPAFRADKNSGIISFSAEDPGLTLQMKNVMKRPPMPNAFTKSVKQVKVSLEPGAIRKDHLTIKTKMYMNTWASIFWHVFNNTRDALFDFGRFSVLAFEKKCNTEVDEPFMSIGYELNAYYKVAGFVRNVGATIINDAA